MPPGTEPTRFIKDCANTLMLGLTWTFTRIFATGLLLLSPLLACLVASIIAVGLLIARRERWPWDDALYFAFVTATTVGYGDFRPTARSSKLLAIVIAFVGLLLTGMIVAVGLYAAQVTLTEHYGVAGVDA
ncbi:MAG: potassium channel family protein [Pseudomonadota bacterium]|nr:potassium channel family protein [Pseudomonadota bacterium]